MRVLIRLCVSNPVSVHIITLIVIVIGTYTFIQMPRELEPDMSFNWALIRVTYPGVSPVDIEVLITKPIEDKIADIEKIESIASVSSEGVSSVSVKFEPEIHRDQFDRLVQELQNRLDQVALPAQAGTPTCLKLESSSLVPLVNVVLPNVGDESHQYRLANRLKQELESIDGVLQASALGLRKREIQVLVDPIRLDQYGLTLPQVVDALTARGTNVPAGKVEIGGYDHLLRAITALHSVEQIEQLIIQRLPGDGSLRISDVARVEDTFEPLSTCTRINGHDAVTFGVTKHRQGNTIEIVDQIHRLVGEWQTRLGLDAHISLVNDTSIRVRDSIGILSNNAAIGGILVICVLCAFMGARHALFVALGLPVTLLATFAFMGILGESLNSNSLFALVLTLGLVVDDAIVVVENIYRWRQRGNPIQQSVVQGTHEVAWPVLTASLTTVAAFLPLALLPGTIGRYLRVVPIVVTLALGASLLECFCVLPVHVTEWARSRRLRHPTQFVNHMRKNYIKLLKHILRYRYVVFAVLVSSLLLSVLIVPWIGVDLWRGGTWQTFSVYVHLPAGTPLGKTKETMLSFEELALALPDSEVKDIIMTVGHIATDRSMTTDSHVGSLIVELTPESRRERSIDEVMQDLRQRCTKIPGVEHVEFMKWVSGPPVGADIEVICQGDRWDQLRLVVDEMKHLLRSIPNVTDIQDNHSVGKQELRIVIDEQQAAYHGLAISQIGTTVHAAFQGITPMVFRDGNDEIDVVVKLHPANLEPSKDIANIKFLDPLGNLVPLQAVASLEHKMSSTAVHRFNRKRAITVTAHVDSDKVSKVEVNRRIQQHFADIRDHYPGVWIELRGQFAEFNTAFQGILHLFVFGLLLIYYILGTQFGSFTLPMIILAAVPFAFIGAMLGLVLSGDPLTIAAMYGFVALAGIVVNDSIVLVEFVNRRHRAGAQRWRAILGGAQVRFRAILLTSVTTVSGLLPMMLGIGGYSPNWVPMASTLVWGLSIATLLNLFGVPVLYAIMSDIQIRRKPHNEGKEAGE